MAENTTTLALHPMKKIEIIVKGDQAQFVRDLMERTGITGYTMIRDVAGMGHHGFHEGKLLFNDTSSLVVYVAVAPEDTIGPVKQEHVRRAVEHYLARLDGPPVYARIDIVAVILPPGGSPKITHYENAF